MRHFQLERALLQIFGLPITLPLQKVEQLPRYIYLYSYEIIAAPNRTIKANIIINNIFIILFINNL